MTPLRGWLDGDDQLGVPGCPLGPWGSYKISPHFISGKVCVPFASIWRGWASGHTQPGVGREWVPLTLPPLTH